jgi:VanZ family protein
MNKTLSYIYLLLFIISLFGSFYLFSLPGASLPSIYWLNIPNLDKYIHAGIFFTLCYTGAIALSIINRGNINNAYLSLLCILFILYGIGIEFYQESFVEGRAFEIADIVADGIGCLFFLIWFLIRRPFKKVGPDRNRDLNQN